MAHVTSPDKELPVEINADRLHRLAQVYRLLQELTPSSAAKFEEETISQKSVLLECQTVDQDEERLVVK